MKHIKNLKLDEKEYDTNPAETIEIELNRLVKSIQDNDPTFIDKKWFESHTDGETLAYILRPIIQSATIKLKDIKGFRKLLLSGL